jgi:hypothetical protein
LVYGEDRFSERWPQVVDEADYKDASLGNMMRISRGVGRDVRNAGVSFWTHAEVVGLSPELQRVVLETAVEDGLYRREVRELAAQYKRLGGSVSGWEQGNLIDVDPETITCPTCSGAGVLPVDVPVDAQVEAD